MAKKTKIILGITGIVLFMVLFVIGVTYAWFNSNLIGNEAAKDTIVQTGTLSINYSNGYNIEGKNILPNWSETKTFTVENTGSREAFYELDWANITNEFINKENLVYSITGVSNGTKEPGSVLETMIPTTGTNIKIFSNIEIEPKEIHTYTIILKYKDNGNQNSDMGKNLNGKLGVKSSTKYKNCLETNNCLVDKVSVGQFVDYTPPIGKSSTSKTCYRTFDNQYSGWRVLSKEGMGLTGKVTLVHSGTPECYYHSINDMSSVNNLNNIAFSYVNNKLANFGRSINCSDIKTYDVNACTTNNPTIDNDIIKTGTYYWVAYLSVGRLECVNYKGSVHNNAFYTADYSGTLGVRPVIVLKSGIKKTGGNGTNESAFTISN